MSTSEAVAEVLAGPSGPSIGAFFDYDGTVIHGFSAGAFYSHRLRQLEIGPVEAFNTIRHMIRGVTTETEFERLMGVVFANLAGRPLEELSAIGEKIFATQIAGRVFPEAWQLIRAHERMGHTLVLASSASRFQVEPAARSLGITHVLCTDAEVNEEGRLTGKTRGNALWRQGKAQAVLDFAKEQKIQLEESFAYSNGDEDVPFLSTVGRPRAINPGKLLLAHAQKSGWPVLRFADRGRPSITRIARTTAAYGGMATAMGAGLAFGVLNRDKQVGLDTVSALIGDLALPLVGVRLNVQGQEHLWSQRPAVFMFNHQSQLDMPILCKLLRGGFTAVAKKELANDPFFGVAFRAAGVAFVDRSGKADPRTALEPAVQRLREGVSVVIAPEGTRSLTPALDAFKKGGFHLAMQAGVPVVPIVIRNAGERMWRDSATIGAGDVDIVVLPPIDVSHWSADGLEDHIAEVRRLYLETLADWPIPD